MDKKDYTKIVLGVALLVSLGFNVSDLDMIDDNSTHSCDSPTFQALLRCDEGLSSTNKTCKRSFGTNKRCTEGWQEIVEDIVPQYISMYQTNAKEWDCNVVGCMNK